MIVPVDAHTSAALAATSAPASARGRQRAAVRFQTTRSTPARARRSAIGCPITPRPRKPTRDDAPLTMRRTVVPAPSFRNDQLRTGGLEPVCWPVPCR